MFMNEKKLITKFQTDFMEISSAIVAFGSSMLKAFFSRFENGAIGYLVTHIVLKISIM